MYKYQNEHLMDIIHLLGLNYLTNAVKKLFILHLRYINMCCGSSTVYKSRLGFFIYIIPSNLIVLHRIIVNRTPSFIRKSNQKPTIHHNLYLNIRVNHLWT